MTLSNGQGIVHKLKYDGGDCVSEHLRVLFPDLHSKFCDDAVNFLVDAVVKIVVPPAVDKVCEMVERPLAWIDDPMRGE
jgi:hypothetical protein